MRIPRFGTLALALVTLLTTPAAAQDCWQADTLEPNDFVGAPLDPGLHTGLTIHVAGLQYGADVDRYVVSVPPYQRLVVDFESPQSGLAGLQLDAELFCTLRALDGSGPSSLIHEVGGGPDLGAEYGNPTAQAVDVEITVNRPGQGSAAASSCLTYDLHVAVVRRPCDLLADDPLEGPDQCAAGTVLQPGLHRDLIVFNDQRIAGSDEDHFRVLGVEPGNGFAVTVLQDGTPYPSAHVEVSELPSCSPLTNSWRTQFVVNESGVPIDYSLRVSTDSTLGFARYDLLVEYLSCSSVAPDALEPNGACGPFPLLSEGMHDGLTIGPGDVDAFEVVVPAGEILIVRARSQGDGGRMLVSGAPTGQCVPVGTGSGYGWSNQSTVPVHRLVAVTATPGYCANYGLEIEFLTDIASPIAAQLVEPNDDCTTATDFSYVVNADQQLVPEMQWVFLDVGDVDSFRLSVPPGAVYRAMLWPVGLSEPEPAFELLAYPGGDCSTVPLRTLVPESPFGGSYVEAELLLPNRGATPLDYVLQVRTASPVAGTGLYELWIDADPPHVTPASGLRCEDAVPILDASSADGLLGLGHSLYYRTTVEAGESFTAVASEEPAIHLGVPTLLRFHTGTADCNAGGASLGETMVVHATSPPSIPQLTRLTYVNTGTAPQEVIVEYSASPQCSAQTYAELLFHHSDAAPYSTFCSPLTPERWSASCPCDNGDVLADHLVGCRNSTGSGGRLFGDGSNVLAHDDLQLHAEGLPPLELGALYLTSNYANGSYPFFDGLLCISTSAVGFTPVYADHAGRWSAPGPLQSLPGGLGPRVDAQIWYRDPAGPCGSGSNTTNAIRVDWQP